MSEPARHWISVDEYLYQEERSEFKSEYFNGEVFAMAGGTAEHNEICTNVAYELVRQLQSRPCRIYSSDQRVKIPDTGLYTYPDVMVVCGERQFADRSRQTLENPVLIVEVLSPSTEAYDRGDKFAHYQRIPTLREFVLIASDKRRMERFSRQGESNEWLLTICREPNASLELPSVGCRLEMDGVYRKVEFPAGEPSLRSASEDL